jgi:ABC-2 type transport system ATP-binding protein
MPEAIELKTLQKVIDQTLVVDIDELTVAPGEIAGLVGPVGSGKDCVLDLLTGRSRPTLGTVSVVDIDPQSDKKGLSERVGVLFTEDSLYQQRSPRGNLRFHCRLRGLSLSRVEEVLVHVGLADHANASLDKLPSGLARRLAFGRAILHQPDVLLLMDPFARCDEASISLLSTLMRQLAEEGTAILILADDDSHLNTLCDVIHILNKGRITETIYPEEEQAERLPFKIPVRLEGKVALVNPGDILYAYADEGRTFLQTTTNCLPTQFTLAELEERLLRSGFFRAHRSYLVNLQHVREVIPYTRNSFSLRLNDAGATEIPLSKSAAAELRDLLGY